MTSNVERLVRQQAIERQIRRLHQRIIPLQILSDRVSWARVGLFVIGIFSVYGIGTQANVLAGWCAFAAAVLLFAIVVSYHRSLSVCYTTPHWPICWNY